MRHVWGTSNSVLVVAWLYGAVTEQKFETICSVIPGELLTWEMFLFFFVVGGVFAPCLPPKNPNTVMYKYTFDIIKLLWHVVSGLKHTDATPQHLLGAETINQL